MHVHGEVTGTLFLPLLAARPSVVTLHGLHLLRRTDGIARLAAELNLRAVVGAADRTICVSRAEQEVLAKVSDTRKTVVVHNGVSSKKVEPAQLDLAPPVGIWVGSLDERRIPSPSCGPPSERPPRWSSWATARYEATSSERRERTCVSSASAKTCRICSQPRTSSSSCPSAGISFALLEAMGQGPPSIVADIPENVELIGDSGWPIPYGDEEALVSICDGSRGTPANSESSGLERVSGSRRASPRRR